MARSRAPRARRKERELERFGAEGCRADLPRRLTYAHAAPVAGAERDEAGARGIGSGDGEREEEIEPHEAAGEKVTLHR